MHEYRIGKDLEGSGRDIVEVLRDASAGIAGVSILFFSWAETESTWYCGHCFAYCTSSRLYDDDCGEIGGMRIGRGNRSAWRKPAPVPLCPPQIPHDLIRAGIRAAAVGSRRHANWQEKPKYSEKTCPSATLSTTNPT
jgi:hypothetical protein